MSINQEQLLKLDFTDEQVMHLASLARKYNHLELLEAVNYSIIPLEVYPENNYYIEEHLEDITRLVTLSDGIYNLFTISEASWGALGVDEEGIDKVEKVLSLLLAEELAKA